MANVAAAVQARSEALATGEASQWFALRTATRQEERAMKALVEAGYTVFLPMLTRWETLCRGGRKEAVQRPLIPGYLFVLCPSGTVDQAVEVERVHAAVTYVGVDQIARPFPFPTRVVLGLQLEEAAGAFDYTRHVRPAYRPKNGDKVEVVAGTWLGFVGKVLATPKGDRVHVMLDAPGGRTGRTLPVGQVRKVG